MMRNRLRDALCSPLCNRSPNPLRRGGEDADGFADGVVVWRRVQQGALINYRNSIILLDWALEPWYGQGGSLKYGTGFALARARSARPDGTPAALRRAAPSGLALT
jgi:hypothetical protein